MRNIAVSLYICIVALALIGVGCTADASGEQSVGRSVQSLTIAQCDGRYNECVNTYGLFGIVICGLDYTMCVANADNDLPAQVADAIDNVRACRAELSGCAGAASTPAQLATCAQSQAKCVADVVDVELPAIVEETAACVDGGIECITAARSVSDLDGCGETLLTCSVDAATMVLPDDVAEVVNGVVECTTNIDDCIFDASSPSELTACGEQQAVCVADSLGVDLPDVIPLSDVLGCTETAADCAREARSISDVRECADGLVDCGQALVDALEIPQVVDCNVMWTTCMLRNPLNFVKCAQDLRGCLME